MECPARIDGETEEDVSPDNANNEPEAAPESLPPEGTTPEEQADEAAILDDANAEDVQEAETASSDAADAATASPEQEAAESVQTPSPSQEDAGPGEAEKAVSPAGSETEEPSEPDGEAVEAAEAVEAVETAEIAASFLQSATVDGVTVTVSAPMGAFPEGAVPSVKRVSDDQAQQAEQAVDEARDTEQTVVASYTFDISILDAKGNELQPAEGCEVEASFALAEAADEGLTTSVYHMSEDGGDLTAEALPIVEESGDMVTALTEGFSLFTVQVATPPRAP